VQYFTDGNDDEPLEKATLAVSTDDPKIVAITSRRGHLLVVDASSGNVVFQDRILAPIDTIIGNGFLFVIYSGEDYHNEGKIYYYGDSPTIADSSWKMVQHIQFPRRHLLQFEIPQLILIKPQEPKNSALLYIHFYDQENGYMYYDGRLLHETPSSQLCLSKDWTYEVADTFGVTTSNSVCMLRHISESKPSFRSETYTREITIMHPPSTPRQIIRISGTRRSSVHLEQRIMHGRLYFTHSYVLLEAHLTPIAPAPLRVSGEVPAFTFPDDSSPRPKWEVMSGISKVIVSGPGRVSIVYQDRGAPARIRIILYKC
jgi:hypothetical protein